MAKKTYVRIGDVFCVEIDNEYKCFFQYIAQDELQLGGQVIRVFKTHYPMDYVPICEELIKDEVQFYSHTFIRPCMDLGFWYKVGTTKNIGNIRTPYFCDPWRNIKEHASRASHFSVWRIGDNRKVILGSMSIDEYNKYSYGAILPPGDIINKIRTGEYAEFF